MPDVKKELTPEDQADVAGELETDDEDLEDEDEDLDEEDEEEDDE